MANKLVVQADLGKRQISRHIYGHFSEHLGRCIYGGYWVGEESPIPNVRGIRTDVVEALKAMKIPNLRWPGGCFADEYHWMDGIGPRSNRPCMINTHWGGVTENNAFGTHEFFDLCEMLDCEPYICGNLGSGTVHEMQQWVEYITFDGRSPMADLRRANGRDEPWKIKFWGVGNENWGCGGSMRPEYYSDEYRRYATYLRNFSGNQLYKIACGSWQDESGQWTDVVMREVGPWRMSGLSYHYYCGSGKKTNSATKFEEVDWFHQLKNALRMDELLRRHETIMDRHDPEKRVAIVLDEWGAWHGCESGTNPGFLYQQNSMRDALVAGVSLNILNEHCERVRIANIAQTINVLQAVILTEGEKMLLTPTYHVFEMFKAHQDATLLPSALETDKYEFEKEAIPAVNASASRSADGTINVSLCNANPNKAAAVTVNVRGANVSKASGRVLAAKDMTAHNTFEKPAQVKPAAFRVGAPGKTGLKVNLPPMSVVVLQLE